MKPVGEITRLLAFTAGGAAVFTLYLIIPSILAANAIFAGSWAGMFVVFTSLAVAELAIYTVLVRTTRKRAAALPRQERRASMRHVADFNVKIRKAHNGAVTIGRPINARAIDASAGGIAVLVEPDQWESDHENHRVQIHVPGDTAAIEAESVGAANVVVNGRQQRLVRLRLSEIGRDHAPPDVAGDGPNGGHNWPLNGASPGGHNGHAAINADGRSRASGARMSIWSVLAACRQGVQRLALLLPLPLWLVLAVQAVASVSLRNTAFQDEATYLFAGRQIVHHLLGGPAPTQYVGDFLVGTTLYPTLGGALDIVGGLEAARLFSLFWMLCATAAVYVVGKGLYDRTSGLLAAALFGVQGSVLFIGHFATFDAMCVGLLALAAALAVRAGAARTPWLSPFVSVLLLLATATTYIGVLYVPTVLAILCWKSFQMRGWWQAGLRTGLAAAVLFVAAIEAVHRYPGSIAAFNSGIAHRIAAVPEPWSVLVQLTIYLAGIVTALALVGLLLSRRTHLPLALLLLGTSLAAPAYHIYEGEFTSLQKHIAYGLLFAAPLAGYALARLGGHRRLIGVVLCLLIFTTGYQADRRLNDWWPNSSAMIAVLRAQVHPGDRILAEEHEVVEYYLTKYEADLGTLHWNQTYGFNYTDAAGHYFEGVPAYKAAIADGYFDLVVLRYSPTIKMDRAIDSGLRDGTRYELVAKIPYNTAFGPSAYWIWRKRPVVAPAAPHLTPPAAHGVAPIGALRLSRTSVSPGETITASVTLRNTGDRSVVLRNVVIAGRPPGGTNAGGPFDDFGSPEDVTLAPGQTITLQRTRTFTGVDPRGTWYSFVTYQDAEGDWHDDPARVHFTVGGKAVALANTAGCPARQPAAQRGLQCASPPAPTEAALKAVLGQMGVKPRELPCGWTRQPLGWTGPPEKATQVCR